MPWSRKYGAHSCATVERLIHSLITESIVETMMVQQVISRRFTPLSISILR
jgi:hypothetical protein